jgi:hypothetical protein
MKKMIVALMLCLVSISGFAYVNSSYVFGAMKSSGECKPKSYNWKDFSSVEWALLNDNNNIVLGMGEGSRMMFMVSKQYTDTNSGIKVIEAVEGQTGTACKLYYYLNEAATKALSEDGKTISVYEIDIYDYMNRTIISILFMPIEE